MAQKKYDRENLMGMDPELLRAIIRERGHHTLESYIYRALSGNGGIPPTFGKRAKELLDVWDARGLADDVDDVRWVKNLLELGYAIREGKSIDLETEPVKPFPIDEQQAVEKVIWTRRSVRNWTGEKVSKEHIHRIIDAGLWAPSSCNLQTVRVIVMQGEKVEQVFKLGEVRDIKTMLVVCQDVRGYEFFDHQIPDYNCRFDCGAAVQNMLLMAHALGLGAVWLTYGPDKKQKIKALYNLPDYIEIETYIALGWPAESPLPPGRMAAEEVILT